MGMGAEVCGTGGRGTGGCERLYMCLYREYICRYISVCLDIDTYVSLGNGLPFSPVLQAKRHSIGIEPTIFCLGGRRTIYCTTGTEWRQRSTNLAKRRPECLTS